jgi:hypothetical protein
VNVKSALVVVLFIVILAGATGGDDSVRTVGSAIGKAIHWVNVTWDSLVNDSTGS